MTTLTITPRGSTKVQTIHISNERAAPIGSDETGQVDVVATGGDVLIRFGSPDPDAYDSVVIRDGDHRTLEIEPPAYAMTVPDGSLAEY